MIHNKIFEKDFLRTLRTNDITKVYEFLYSLDINEVIILLNKFSGKIHTRHTIKNLVIKESRNDIAQLVRRQPLIHKK